MHFVPLTTIYVSSTTFFFISSKENAKILKQSIYLYGEYNLLWTWLWL